MVNEEKRLKLIALEKQYGRKAVWLGVKNLAIFLVLTVFTIVLDAYLFTPVNVKFAFICGLFNGFAFARLMRADYLELDEKLVVEVKKILEEENGEQTENE